MAKNTSTGEVFFKCIYCGVEEKGGPEDARISGAVLNAGETQEKYRRLILNAAFDRVNQRVKKQCPQCGVGYLTQIRVGEGEVVVYTCECGYDSSRAV